MTDYLVEGGKRVVEQFFRRRVRLRCDGESTTLALGGKLRVKTNGPTPCQDASDGTYSFELLPFGELVLFSIPLPHTRRTKQNRTKNKGDSGWTRVTGVDDWTKTAHTSLKMVERLHELSAYFL